MINHRQSQGKNLEGTSSSSESAASTCTRAALKWKVLLIIECISLPSVNNGNSPSSIWKKWAQFSFRFSSNLVLVHTLGQFLIECCWSWIWIWSSIRNQNFLTNLSLTALLTVAGGASPPFLCSLSFLSSRFTIGLEIIKLTRLKVLSFLCQS